MCTPLILLATGCAFNHNVVSQSYSGPSKPDSEIACLLVHTKLHVSIEGHPGFRPPVPWKEAYPYGGPGDARMTNGKLEVVPGNRMVGGLIELLPGIHVLEVQYYERGCYTVIVSEKPTGLAFQFAAGHSYVLKCKSESLALNSPVRFWVEDVTGDPKWAKRIQATRNAAMKKPSRRFQVPEDGRP